jgi:hypothetical protein
MIEEILNPTVEETVDTPVVETTEKVAPAVEEVGDIQVEDVEVVNESTECEVKDESVKE